MRTLAASPPTLPDETAALGVDAELMALLQDPETRFWEVTERLFEQGEAWRILSGKADRLTEQVNDPALQGHPKHDEAVARLHRWLLTLNAIEAEARTLRGWLAHCWQRMPKARREILQEEPAFPRARMAAQVAGQVWVMAKAGRPIPGRCPF